MVLGEIPHYLQLQNRRSFDDNDIRQYLKPTSSKNSIDYAPFVRIQLEENAGLTWHYESQKVPYPTLQSDGNLNGLNELHQYLDKIILNLNESKIVDIPVLAYYSMNRDSLTIPKEEQSYREFHRFEALRDALNVTPDFGTVFEWFFNQENLEHREKFERQNLDYQLSLLKTVRQAICRMLPDTSHPRTQVQPLRLVIDLEMEGATKEILSLEQLSGGYRVMLSLVMDLARRLALANPHREEHALESEAIVLIDEIDLHLHPIWQQRVLVDLMKTFPNTQFIVTTHSAPVLTTIKSENIVLLYYTEGKLVANSPTSNTYGAQVGRVLNEIMDVEQRPPAEFNEFTQLLELYRKLIQRDEGEGEEALKLRYQLNRLSASDPELLKADMEIRRRRVLRRITFEKGLHCWSIGVQNFNFECENYKDCIINTDYTEESSKFITKRESYPKLKSRTPITRQCNPYKNYKDYIL
jgi:predicted ATP-binding protein involved in virulence